MWVCVLLYMWIYRALELPIIKKQKTVYEAKNNSDASHIMEVAKGRCTSFQIHVSAFYRLRSGQIEQRYFKIEVSNLRLFFLSSWSGSRKIILHH